MESSRLSFSWCGVCRYNNTVIVACVGPSAACRRRQPCECVLASWCRRGEERPPEARNLRSHTACVANMRHRRGLSSASSEQLDVPTCRRSAVGGRAFPVAAAKVWNSLPSDVTSASSLSVLKNSLKTYTCSAAATKLFDFD